MAGVTVTRTLTANSEFGRQLMNAAADQIRRQLEEVGAMAVARTDDLVDSETVYGGTGGKRKGGRHLLGSFDYRIEGTQFPIRITLYSHANKEKVAALEEGAEPHEIAPRAKVRLKFPSTQTPGKTEKPKKVNHPGNQPYNFMRRGLASAIQATYRQAIRIR